MRGKHYKESHAVLSYYFNIEPSSWAPGDVADKIGVPYTTFMKWVSGEHACPAEKMVKIYEVTGYEAILLILAPAGLQFVEESPVVPDKKTVEAEIMDDICTSTKACQMWREIMADGKVTKCEADKMLCVLSSQKREIDQTIALVKELAI